MGVLFSLSGQFHRSVFFLQKSGTKAYLFRPPKCSVYTTDGQRSSSLQHVCGDAQGALSVNGARVL